MKNLIKSIFISTYIAYLMLVVGISISVVSKEDLIWLPVIATALTPVLFFAFLFLKKPSNVKMLRYLVWGISLISFSDVLLLFILSEEPNTTAITLASSAIVLWFIYEVWYSKFSSKDGHHRIEQSSMDGLVFKDSDNKSFKPEDHLGLYNIYMFHRGDWCPLCMAQVRDIAESYIKLEKLGVKTFIISPSTEKMTHNIAKKYDVNFHFLRDENLAMSRKLEIRQEFGVPLGIQVFGFSSDTIYPTIVITDSKNIIIHQGQSNDYRNRPEPESFLQIITDHSGI